MSNRRSTLDVPPTHAAVTAFATRAKRNVIVRAGKRRAGGFPPGLSVRLSHPHAPAAQPSERSLVACGAA